MKFATQPIQQHAPHLMYVATLPWEINNSADKEENANNLHGF